jgi:HEAT repeat protein
MNFDPISNLQLPLFVYGEPVENIVDVLPSIWNATEALSSPDPIARHHGIDALLELGAQRISPLVAFMIAIGVSDPDIYIRRRVAYILADLINNEPAGRQAPENVRKVVTNYLHNMREETIFSLLEVSVIDPLVEKSIFHLLNACPVAGKYLGDIASQWKNPLPIRQKAIHFVGLVGYLEALPVLERLLNRLEARQNGQYAMAFAPSSIKSSDEDIMPYLRLAINRMSAR